MAGFHDKFQAFRTKWYLNFRVSQRLQESLGPKSSILSVFWVSGCFEKLMEAVKNIFRKKQNLFSLQHCSEFIKTVFVYRGNSLPKADMDLPHLGLTAG